MSFLGGIGLLTERVGLQSLSTILDAAGQPIETWTTTLTVWGRVMPQRGGERFTARQIMGQAVSVFRIRYRTGLTVNGTRLSYDGRTWDIHDIREVGRNDGLEMDATARSEG